MKIGQIIHDLNRLEHSETGVGETAPPDPKKHFWVSMIKSFVRMAGFVLLPTSIYGAVELLVIAEFIGMVEELV